LQEICSPGPARIASHLQKGMLAWLQIIYFATKPPTWPGLQTFCVSALSITKKLYFFLDAKKPRSPGACQVFFILFYSFLF
jgi:hypothetical protein